LVAMSELSQPLQDMSHGPKSFSYSWRVKNYPFIENSITSSPFSPPNSRDIWFLSLSVLTTNKSISNSCYCILSVRLKQRSDLSDASIIASFAADMTIGDHKQSRALLRQVLSAQDLDSTGSGLTFTFTGCSDAFAVRHLHDDVIITIEIFYHPTDTDLTGSPTSGSRGQNLLSDLSSLLNYSLHLIDPDITLIAKDGSVRCHKFILIARSDVFRAMFDHDCDERRTGTITMIDATADVLRELVHFLTSDEVRNMNKHAIDLFVLADKYNITKLKHDCETHISQNVNDETSIRLLDLCRTIRSKVIEKSLFMHYRISKQ
jgi:hypothetical protein